MPATVIVGAQWGDEGKGKIVDLLALDSDLVCRYQGGPNAGHTIVVDGETFKIRQIPSGVLRGKICVIGAGCVVDPEVFLAEVDELERAGISTAVVHLSGKAHLIMPWHVAIDQAQASGGSASSDRHHEARHRPLLRGQGGEARHPRPGSARAEDPAPEDRSCARGEERLARARVRRSAARAGKSVGSAGVVRATDSLLTSPTHRCSSTGHCTKGARS